MPSMNFKVPFKSKLHKDVLSAVVNRVDYAFTEASSRHASWRKDEEQYLAYIPEKEADRLAKAARENVGDPDQFTLIVPYSYATIMTAHTYSCSTMLSRSPVFQFEGRHGEAETQIQAVEAYIDYQVRCGGMMVPFYIWLLDPYKYGVGAVQSMWDEDIAYVSEIKEVPVTFAGVPIGGKTKKVKTTTEVISYIGNRIRNVRPYDFATDPRKPLTEYRKGEFVVTRSDMTLADMQDLDFINLDEVKKLKPTGAQNRVSGSSQIDEPRTESSLTYDGIEEIGTYEVETLEIRLVPSEWKLGKTERRELWCLSTVNRQIVVEARPVAAYHNDFSLDITEYEPDGYQLFKRSMLEVQRPMQYILDWLINSHLYNVRKVLNDVMLVDPSLVQMGDFYDPLPGRLVRMKERAYGANLLDQAVKQFDVRDVTGAHFQSVQMLSEMMQRSVGVTDPLMGIAPEGGRRTAQEFRGTSSFAVNRLKTNVELQSHMGWANLARKLVSNSQQYYDAEMMLKIVGDTARLKGSDRLVEVAPETISGYYDFITVDGTMPIDRYAQASLWQTMLASMAQVPGVLETYDMGGLFAWVGQLAGMKNIQQFRLEISDYEKLRAQVEAGNVLTLREAQNATAGVVDPTASYAGGAGGPGAGGNGAIAAGGVQQPNQIPGMGPGL